MPALACAGARHHILRRVALPIRLQQSARSKSVLDRIQIRASTGLATPGPSVVGPLPVHRRRKEQSGTPAQVSHLDGALQLLDFERYLGALRDQRVGTSPDLHARTEDTSSATRHQQFIRLAVQSERLDAGLELLQLVPKQGRLWTLLLTEVTAKDGTQGLNRLLRARQAAGLSLDSWQATESLKAAGDHGDRKVVSALLEQCWSEGCISTFVCNAAIQAFTRCGDPQAALGVYEDMQLRNIQPTVHVYNSLISVAGRHNKQAVAEHMYNALLKQGLQPTEFTFSLAFRAFCGMHHHKTSWILQVANSMPSFGVQMNEYVIVPFLKAVRNSKLTRGQVVSIGVKIGNFLEQRRWHGTAYAAMLNFCADHPELGISLIRSIWNAAQQARCATDHVLASALFSACAANATSEALPLVRQAHGQLEVFVAHHDPAAAGTRSQSMHGSRHGHGDLAVSYRALLHAYAACRSLAQAVALFKALPSKGVQPSVVTYNTMINGHAQAGDAQGAFHLLHDMQRRKLSPDVVTFGALMHACASNGRLSDAMQAFTAMQAAGIQPNAEVYTSLIDAHVKAGSNEAIQQAFRILQHMRARGIPPTSVTYGCLVAACNTIADADMAFKLYQESRQQGLKDDGPLLDLLIQVCASTNRLDEGMELVKQLHWAHGHDAHGVGLDRLAHALAGASVDRALRIISLLRTRGAQPSRATLLRLMSACARSSHPHEARRLYWELRQQGGEASVSAGSNVIMALCRANKPLHALSVFDDMMHHGPLPAQAPQDESSSDDARSAVQEAAEVVESLPDMTASLEVRSAEPFCVLGRMELIPEAPHSGAVRTRELEQSVFARSSLAPAQPGRALTPSAAALKDLVQTLAVVGELHAALRVYTVLRHAGKGTTNTVISGQPMWQALLEACCRQSNVTDALKVFDDWKAFAQRHAAAEQPCATPRARLSNVSLAFLEACCRSSPEHAWRVFDICAEMRHQSELRQEARLPRPQKASHHFAG